MAMSQRRFWALAPRACTQFTTVELRHLLPAPLIRLAPHVRPLFLLGLLVEVKFHGQAYTLWLTELATERRPASEIGALQAPLGLKCRALLVLKCQRK